MAQDVTSGYIFTPEQLQKHSKVYAGPGAGKTYFLVENVKNIVKTHPLIIQSWQRKVLCVTYTNAAVDEIKQRLENYSEYVEVCTIHGFIIEHIIQPFQQVLLDVIESDFGMTLECKGKISSQIEGLGLLHGVDKNKIFDLIRKQSPVDTGIKYSKKKMGEIEVDNAKFVESVLNPVKRVTELKVPKDVNPRHARIIKEYVWSKVKRLTHNEILYFGYRILETSPIALYSVRVKFPFIFVDEFQDTNPLQTLIIRLIAKKSSAVTMVGDIAQSIYSFHGARPRDFKDFIVEDGKELEEYVIRGNRRSTENIINFCNFLRQSDNDVRQTRQRIYKTQEQEKYFETKKIHFLIGRTPVVNQVIQDVIQNGGVVLTRSWAAAFDYIQGIEASQVALLKKIYNSYYVSPVKIREEIASHNNVTWVRAFRFIFSLWKGYRSYSLIDVINALRLYWEIDIKNITPESIIQLKLLLQKVFEKVGEQSVTSEIIKGFNEEISKSNYDFLRESLFGGNFFVNIFDSLDSSTLQDAVAALLWETSYKLFTEVFSEHSKYMTVHQAKGLEWSKVVVAVFPVKNESKLEDMFADPKLNEETKKDEFARIYYVACSRAKDDLYIHLEDGASFFTLKASLESYMRDNGITIDYEVIK